jgi:hypothetical protein
MSLNASQMHRAKRQNRYILLVSVLALILGFSLPDQSWSSGAIGIASGVFGASALFEFWLYRRREKFDPDVIDESDRNSAKRLLISAIATWSALEGALVATSFPDTPILFWSGAAVFGILLPVALWGLPRMMKDMRLHSQFDQLNDERLRANWDGAYRRALVLSFQLAMLLGIALLQGWITLPAGFAVLSLGIWVMASATVLFFWAEWKDAR